ncbi:TPR-like protein [Obba rivulosa]|uniref:TPR-like protein n=1 Tax=Obba rivulosa TaxID=1052685 RepID=A0A8E2DU95_9APHY|nr:TPR-like protein [Obba rivulosa]
METEEYDVEKCLNIADELKAEGNEHFRAKQWEEALSKYRSALGHLPKRKQREQTPDAGKGKGREVDPEDEPEYEATESPANAETAETEEVPLTEAEVKCAKARAVLNANIGACYVKIGDHKEVVAACTAALRDDPTYVKALQRRASSNEQVGSWSSLSSAQEDYETLLKALPPDSPEVRSIKRSLQSLKPRIEAAQKQETAEMVDKLKGLGNSILGNFGLSTDNFQFVPNGQGGYSMNFVR